MKGMYQMAALGCCARGAPRLWRRAANPICWPTPALRRGSAAGVRRAHRPTAMRTAAVAVCVMTMQMPRSTAPSVRCCGLRPGRRSISASGSRPMAYAGKAATAAPGFICRASMRRALSGRQLSGRGDRRQRLAAGERQLYRAAAGGASHFGVYLRKGSTGTARFDDAYACARASTPALYQLGASAQGKVDTLLVTRSRSVCRSTANCSMPRAGCSQ